MIALALLCFCPILVAPSTNMPTYQLPGATFSDLISLDDSASALAFNSLVTLGALQITNIPNFDLLKKRALEDLPQCLLDDSTAVTSAFGHGEKYGAHRRSPGLASASSGKSELSNGCTGNAMALRATVDAAARQLFLAIEKAIVQTSGEPAVTDIMQPYRSLSDLMAQGRHLEHFHAFYNITRNRKEEDDNMDMDMDMHTDAGILIAMTTGYYSHAGVKNGLYMKLPSGAVVEVSNDEDALLILVGEAGARWLSSAALGGVALRAVPHALRFSTQGKLNAALSVPLTRAWYGKMYLPPLNAIIKLSSSSRSEITYDEYRRRELQILSSSPSPSAPSLSFPSACGPMVASDLQIFQSSQGMTGWGASTSMTTMASSTPCKTRASIDDGIMCWAQCVSVAALPCGQQAQCIDTDTGDVSEGDKMCKSVKGMRACVPTCPAATPSPNSSGISKNGMGNSYCYGAGSVMYMGGFASSLYGGYECLNLLFVFWILNSRWKLAFACLASFALGVFIQCLTKARLRHFAMRTTSRKAAVGVGLYGVQVIFSYFAMLIAMSYSLELFFALCAGLTLGYAFFLLKVPPPLSTEPCCASTDDTLNAITNGEYNSLDSK